MAIRVGFHFGPAIDDNNDVFGDTVNVAARMAGLAKAGQIITTESSVNLMSELLRQSTRDIDALTVKGKEIDIRVHEVIWQEHAELTMKSGSIAPPVAREARVRLRHGASEILLDAQRPAVSLGRDASCDIVIRDTSASRNHGKIERRRDKFVLVDISTNGTYVLLENGSRFFVQREEFTLHDRGIICLGQAVVDKDPDLIHYQCIQP